MQKDFVKNFAWAFRAFARLDIKTATTLNGAVS